MVGGVSLMRAYRLTTPIVGRKIMHCTTGPVFILCWLLFPPHPISPYLAASVPLLVSLYFVAASFADSYATSGVTKNVDDGSVAKDALKYLRNRYLVSTVSRSGHASELRAGPMHYGLLHALAAMIYWTRRPTGMVALVLLCVGDGVADLVGRPLGSIRWPYNRSKSLEGSLAFIIAGMTASMGMMAIMQTFGLFKQIAWSSFTWQLPLLSVFAAFVESLPLGPYDNIGVCAGVAILAHAIGW